MKKENKPPKVFHNFFRWFCHPRLRDHIEGDLLETYKEQVTTLGKRKADTKFITDVLLLFRPGIIKPAREYKNSNNYDMIKSYFKIGFRNLSKRPFLNVIKIAGLTVAASSAVVILLFV